MQTAWIPRPVLQDGLPVELSDRQKIVMNNVQSRTGYKLHTINSRNEFRHAPDTSLDTGLGLDIIILYPIKKAR